MGWEQERAATLMLYSLVDDRSGAAYNEYHVVFGEDVKAALRFLYRAMAIKEIEGLPFQGISLMICTEYVVCNILRKCGYSLFVFSCIVGREVP